MPSKAKCLEMAASYRSAAIMRNPYSGKVIVCRRDFLLMSRKWTLRARAAPREGSIERKLNGWG